MTTELAERSGKLIHGFLGRCQHSASARHAVDRFLAAVAPIAKEWAKVVKYSLPRAEHLKVIPHRWAPRVHIRNDRPTEWRLRVLAAPAGAALLIQGDVAGDGLFYALEFDLDKGQSAALEDCLQRRARQPTRRPKTAECLRKTTYHVLSLDEASVVKMSRQEYARRRDWLVRQIRRLAPRHDICAAVRDSVLMALQGGDDLELEPEGDMIAYAVTDKRLSAVAYCHVDDAGVEIDLLCSAKTCDGATTHLVAYIHNLARAAGYDRVKLNAVNNAEEYYTKIGMIHDSRRTYYHPTNRSNPSRITTAQFAIPLSPSNAATHNAVSHLRNCAGEKNMCTAL